MVNFIKYRFWYFGFSLAVILTGLYFYLNYGFVYSLDLTGGGLIEFSATTTKSEKAKTIVEKNNPKLNYQQISTGFIISGTRLKKEQANKIAKELSQRLAVKKTRFELVGPSVSEANIYKIITATVLAVLGILIYVAVQFKHWRFGVAAIVALVHDSLVLLGLWAILGYFWGLELDVLFVTAVLTTMSFSVHDTIVIFDKIKEEEVKGSFTNLAQSLNWALNLTMMRSLNNSLTVVIMLTALIILGGESIRGFATSLLIGTIAGTYSSPFVATPVYYLLAKKQ
jgi:preprotein translocase subunit SecF